ncbi:MAG: PTS sugar transporter subunit IIA [Proteobacteria bacterium]|nr:PTS sugar transporter subunit IIA [Pseudomonadota bacterium]
MIGLVLVTQGRLAEEFLAAAEHIVGRQQGVRTVCIGAHDNLDLRRQEIIDAVESVDTGDGVIVLTDMLGGTPCNIAASIQDRPKMEVIAGVNLPMLIKIFEVRARRGLAAAVSAAQEAGRKYICLATSAKAGIKSGTQSGT